MVLDAIKRTTDALLAGVDGRVGRGADLKFGKRVVLDLDGVAGGSFAGGLDTFCLKKTQVLARFSSEWYNKAARTGERHSQSP